MAHVPMVQSEMTQTFMHTHVITIIDVELSKHLFSKDHDFNNMVT